VFVRDCPSYVSVANYKIGLNSGCRSQKFDVRCRARKIKRTCSCPIGINLECAATKNQAYSKCRRFGQWPMGRESGPSFWTKREHHHRVQLT
jgi:hypothetical protein